MMRGFEPHYFRQWKINWSGNQPRLESVGYVKAYENRALCLPLNINDKIKWKLQFMNRIEEEERH